MRLLHAAETPRRSDTPSARDPLEFCPSAPHRAVARLLAMSAGARPQDDVRADLARTTAAAIAGIAAAHYIDTGLASAFEARPDIEEMVPRDLVIFLVEMRAANERRNARLRQDLLEIGARAAERGISLVALKGAADLLSPLHRRAGRRYIGDLDLLAAETDIAAAWALLLDLGAREAAIADINLRDHYHLAPFLSDAWLAQVELHRALGPDDLSRILPPQLVLAQARPSGSPGLRLPSAPHRLAHLVLHARKDAGAQHRLRISLRDVLEFHGMAASMRPADVASAAALLSTDPAREAMASLEAMRCAIFAPDLWDDLDPRRQEIGVRVLESFGRPGAQMWREAAHWMRHYLRESVRNPERRHHFLHETLRPGGLGGWIAHHRHRWRRIR